MLRRLLWSHVMRRVHDDLHATAFVDRFGDEIVFVELALQHAGSAPRAAHSIAEDDLLQEARAALAHLDGARFEEDNVRRDGRDSKHGALPFDDVDGAAVAVYEEAEGYGG